jgi:hypothetical protein
LLGTGASDERNAGRSDGNDEEDNQGVDNIEAAEKPAFVIEEWHGMYGFFREIVKGLWFYRA